MLFFLDCAVAYRQEDVIVANLRRNQAIQFNAPYSSEINPTENSFDTCKGNITDKIISVRTTEDLKNLVNDSFLSIPEELFSRAIHHMAVDIQQHNLDCKDFL